MVEVEGSSPFASTTYAPIGAFILFQELIMAKPNKTLTIIGIIFLAIGLTLAIIGFANFFKSLGSDKKPTLFWCSFVGIPVIVAGGVCLSLGIKHKISQHILNQSAPLLSKSIKIAVDAAQNATMVCECGQENADANAYCTACGKQISIVCGNCNSVLPVHSVYCSHCGNKL